MVVGLEFFDGNFLEVGQESAEVALGGPVVEAFEVILDILRARPLGESHALFFAHYSYHPALAFVGKEVIKANAEDERDAQQRRQRGIQLVAFELGQ